MVIIGSQDRPHLSTEPMAIARDIIASYFTTEQGPTLFEHRGTFWHWEGIWRPRSRSWLHDKVTLALENSWWKKLREDGHVLLPLREKDAPPKTICERVETIVRQDEEKMAPFGLRGAYVNEDYRVTFRDQVVDVKEGEATVAGPDWFDPVTLGAVRDLEVGCPLWFSTIREWSGGDQVWELLLQRLFGYAILPTRKYQRWFLMYGVPRSGKGTVIGVLRYLLGKTAVMNTDLSSLVGSFGTDGLESARVVVVNEVHQLARGEGARAAAIIKQLVGQDPISINIKYVRALRNVESRALPILQSNEIPKLEDRAGGLSSKMVLLPFAVSFLDRENEDLLEQLKGEMTGIAKWALEGARQVIAPPEGSSRFPVPEAAEDAVQDFYSANNPFNAFLLSSFEPDERGWVSFEVVWRRWDRWRREPSRRRDELPYPTRHTFTRELMEGCNWRLGRARRGRENARGFKGMRLKYVPPREDP